MKQPWRCYCIGNESDLHGRTKDESHRNEDMAGVPVREVLEELGIQNNTQLKTCKDMDEMVPKRRVASSGVACRETIQLWERSRTLFRARKSKGRKPVLEAVSRPSKKVQGVGEEVESAVLLSGSSPFEAK
ncbi:hypothetical protein [Paenibacillus segetis]|uniref:hypothetical protein n=1 Tax=Paenibacillus segetis TaxID=1325360 RepID=UPI001669F41F|nr:hypothetical protein [Paenibacillus segetis]